MLRRLLLALSFFLCATAMAAAAGRAPSAAEQASLQRDVAAFLRATEDNDAADIIDALPPRVIPAFTENSNISAKQMRDTLIQNTRAFGAQAKPEDLSADISGLRLRDVKTRPRRARSAGGKSLCPVRR